MDWKHIQKNMKLLSLQLGVMSAYFLLHGTPFAYGETFDVHPRFFATVAACIASEEFLKKECRSAFQNAERQLMDRAPKFSSMAECRFKFQMCEAQPIEQQDGSANSREIEDNYRFLPVALGVEIIRLTDGLYATSILAVETPPDLFPSFSVAEGYESKEDEPGSLRANAYAAIPSSDSFQLFPSLKNHTPVNKFVIKKKNNEALSQQNAQQTEPSEFTQNTERLSVETEESRIKRIKMAPFLD